MKEACALPDIVEVNVEDPNDAFSDMRDVVDMQLISGHKGYSRLALPLDEKLVDEMRLTLKINKRQIGRCLEMLLLSFNRKRKREKDFRFEVKKRLYRFNADALTQMKKEERVEKLNETYETVVKDYERILNNLNKA